MIEASGLTKRYGSYIGIQDVSFRIGEGEAVGLIGPNGAGKTTALRILTCAMSATSGDASIAGFDLRKQSMEARRRVGYLPETPPLYPEMTVETYLRFAASIKGVEPRRIPQRVGAVSELCGLEAMRRRVIGHLSKGYRQRVGIAQALIHEPPAVVLDEPTSGLDPAQIVEIRGLIQQLGGERTVLLTTHILAEAQASCGRLLVISQGRIAADIQLDAAGQPVSAEADGEPLPLESERAYFLAARPADEETATRLRALPGVASLKPRVEDGEDGWLLEAEPGCDIRADAAAAVVRNGGDLLRLSPARASLESLFLDLTQRQPMREDAREDERDARNALESAREDERDARNALENYPDNMPENADA